MDQPIVDAVSLIDESTGLHIMSPELEEFETITGRTASTLSSGDRVHWEGTEYEIVFSEPVPLERGTAYLIHVRGLN